MDNRFRWRSSMHPLYVLEMKIIATISLLILPSLHANEMIKVKASDIGIDAVLVGDSGVEIGKTFSVEGHKDSIRHFLEIKSVNGIKLKSNITESFWGSPTLEENRWYTLKVVEDARYSQIHTPNLSFEDSQGEGRQAIYTGLKLIEIIRD